jgi:Leucine-rich repeat (LRR) protein
LEIIIKMVEEPLKFGNPWTILPVKNAKYARDLTEVHLSDRDLDLLEKFPDFPNLEVVWLNNNKVIPSHLKLLFQLRNLDGMTTNFRIKKVYCQDNSLENVQGITKFKFLDTLLISNNRLRSLDKFLVFLQRFAFLNHLDLFGNPLAEEPDYRLKIIYLMPQI